MSGGIVKKPDADYLIVGSGIVGSAIAAELSRFGKVVLIDQEAAVGYHSTSRSAAIFVDSYGSPPVQDMSAITRQWLDKLSLSGGDQILSPRGIFIAVRKGGDIPGTLFPGQHVLDPQRACRSVPILREEAISAVISEPSAADIDVDRLQQFYLALLRTNGGNLHLHAKFIAGAPSASGWTVTTSIGVMHVTTIINAAGAWADDLAAKCGVANLDLAPLRRSAAIVDISDSYDNSDWPMVVDLGETFYFKPEGKRLLVSPADETPMEPCDAFPDDLDIAMGIDRFEQLTNVEVRRVSHRWAGLRTFADDRLPVIGPDPFQPAFVWASAFGGFGVQTSFGAGVICAQTLGLTDKWSILVSADLVASVSPTRLLAYTRDFPPSLGSRTVG